MAIRCITAAKEFNPEMPKLDDYFTANMVHKLSTMEKSWYEILAIEDSTTSSSHIKKQYKKMALMLHPDKNTSFAADGAFKLIQSAFVVLSDTHKREAYDKRRESKSRNFASGNHYDKRGESKSKNPASGNDQFSSNRGTHRPWSTRSPRPQNASQYGESKSKNPASGNDQFSSKRGSKRTWSTPTPRPENPSQYEFGHRHNASSLGSSERRVAHIRIFGPSNGRHNVDIYLGSGDVCVYVRDHHHVNIHID
ncbi:hypothetical protein CRYUN_Cryun31cG0019100 [Craigia yunnanensis]